MEAAWIVWSGEEGVLWWASKIVSSAALLLVFTGHTTAAGFLTRRALRSLPQSYALVFVLIGGWIVFRFIGPATGLYTLKAGITDIPLN